MAKITEDYVSFETAKLLKEKGFKEMCDSLYGLAYMHNGKYIDEDEEYELESEGRGSEIELVEGGMVYDLWYDNNKDNKHEYSRPTLQRAMKWLREEKGIAVIPVLSSVLDNEKFLWDIKIVVAETYDTYSQGWVYEKQEAACDVAIKYCLENLVK